MAVLVSLALIINPFPTVEPMSPVPVRQVVPAWTPAPPELYDEGEWQWATYAIPVSAASAEPPPTSIEHTQTSATTSPVETMTSVNSEPMSSIDIAIATLSDLGAQQWQLDVFRCLAWFESRNDPYAVSATNDYGLMQINGVHRAKYAGRDIFDPTVNAEVAWQVYLGSGFRAWTTARLCGV